MRLLSIGRPLPDMAIDNHTIFNAPAFFDYDAIAIDSEGVFTSIRELLAASQEHVTHGDAQVVNALTGPGVPAGEILQRRRDELVRALERGALVIVFTHPLAMITEVAGFPGLDRYFFLPAPAGLAWDAGLIRWGEGVQAAVADHRHPFARYVDAIGNDMLYRAHFNDAAPGFANVARVFARSGGGAPVGVEFRVLGGTVVFLPAPRTRGGDAGRKQASSILAATRELLDLPVGDPPSWVRQQQLPGLDELEEASAEAESAVERAEAQREAATGELTQLTRVRDVLWTEGNHALLPAVVRCLELLGFRSYERDDQVSLSDAAGRHELEVEGSVEPIGMAPHYRLRARLDRRIEQEGSPARGLVVANGERLQAPERRKAPIADALRVAAEATSYAVLPTSELFAAASAALEGLDDEVLAAIRARLVEQDGVVTLGDLLGAGEPEDAAALPMSRP